MRTTMARLVAGLALALSMTIHAPTASAQTVVRAAMHSDLKVIDPVWTSALITTHHGFMIYDQLFALDEKLAIKPQMVDTWGVSDDKLTWTFKLRDGLAWHDGTPVTSEDCVSSIKRWAIKDGMGQKLMGFVKEIKASDAKTFTFAMKEPYGLVLDTLGRPPPTYSS